MIVILLLIGFIFWIGYLIGKSSTKQYIPPPQHTIQQVQVIYDLVEKILQENKKIDKETLIVLYAIQYVTGASMTIETALKSAQTYIESDSVKNVKGNTLAQREKESTSGVSTPTTTSYATFTQEPLVKNPIDRTSQLLYFGAFLLVTSIGLFVGFAEVQGGLKVLLLCLVSIILYVSGDYLYSKMKSLQSVGTTFISVSLLSLPFIGIATHTYLLDQQYPELIWLTTSMVSFSAYLFSIQRYRQTLMGYMLIGSAVSSLLSVVGVLALPAHVFLWVLIATGLLLKLFSTTSSSTILITKPAEQFAHVLVPLALFGSMISITTTGSGDGGILLKDTGQLAVSLFLSSLYAYTGAKTEVNKDIAQLYQQAVHPLAVASFTVGVYSYDNSFMQTGMALQLLATVYIAMNLFIKHRFSRSYEPTALLVSAFSILLTSTSATTTSIGILVGIALSISFAIRTKNPLYATVASALFLLFSFIIGQYLLDPRLNLVEQTWFSSGAVFILLVTSLLQRLKHDTLHSQFSLQIEAVSAFGIATVLLSGIATLQEDFIALFTAVWFSLLLVFWLCIKAIAKKDESTYPYSIGKDEWLIIAYMILYAGQITIIFLQTDKSLSYDLPATLATLLASILGALLTRAVWTRWASTLEWLFLPIVFAYTGTLGASYSLPSIALLYGVSAFFLMGSRLIALGRVQESFSKKSIVSLMGGESVSYMIGFLTSLSVVALYSVFATYNSIWQALILTIITMALVWYLTFVERYAQAKALIPVAAQIILGRLLWPDVSLFDDYSMKEARSIIPATSTVIGVLVYSYFYSLTQARDTKNSSELTLSVAMVYASPFYVFLLSYQSWSMAVGLIIAGLLTLHYSKTKSLESKEVAGVVITSGIMWLLANQGVTNIIIHVHIVASLIAIYAIIREHRGYSLKSRTYSFIATLTLTVPLVLAALTQEGVYSLLLLIEMSALFIAGLFVNRKHVYRTGLYTAVGALAYQLRSYGYAVVALIAIVVIGFAIHSALRQDKNESN